MRWILKPSILELKDIYSEPPFNPVPLKVHLQFYLKCINPKGNLNPNPGRMNNPIPMMELDRTENALRDILIQPLITPNEVGLLEVPTKPGLGIEVDETALNKYRI